MRMTKIAALACAGALGAGAAALAACGEDRGSLEVEGGGTVGTTGTVPGTTVPGTTVPGTTTTP